ncbi:hypothetical protein UFOVP648_6 [uncultured Caudovirales phage]|uniref:Uncharacterized protein n=1 Tax=uncultured Caudovirales phage TaxID=2100421 RepID=A0A6J5NG67_9CAUD|nr:hypothetical protein UFOVP648_6 [uncultured Caudovirales phage]
METKQKVQEMYNKFFIRREYMRKEPLFDLYNEITGHKMKASNCSTCLLKVKSAFESYLAQNQ